MANFTVTTCRKPSRLPKKGEREGSGLPIPLASECRKRKANKPSITT